MGKYDWQRREEEKLPPFPPGQWYKTGRKKRKRKNRTASSIDDSKVVWVFDQYVLPASLYAHVRKKNHVIQTFSFDSACCLHDSALFEEAHLVHKEK